MNIFYVWCYFFGFFSILFMFIGLNLLILNFSLILDWNFLSLNSVSFSYIIYMDWISMVFSSVVLFISSMVILYSKVYMGEYNCGSVRFLFLVLMFVLSMLLMVMSPNLVSILLGWDGLGLVSYLLVIYYMTLSSYLAGMITCLINRLGDIGLLISISWLFSYGSWNFMFYLEFFEWKIFFLIIISSFTKSAQVPFSMWLPAAMSAPTPVSALVHSSTLVTAGVYLLIRFFNSLNFNSTFLLFISISTMIMSSICANYEFDLKKIIALSTLSQLGLMMTCLFMQLPDLAFFHLLSHAMFKSLLFLCAGIVIHFMSGCQDIRFMGGVSLTMPLTSCCFNVSNLALCGFPFLSGFYSSDLAIETISFFGVDFFMVFLLYFSLGLTSLYSIRLFFYTMISNMNYLSFLSLGDNMVSMKYSLVFLSFFSVVFGCSYTWLMDLDMSFLILPFYLKMLSIFMVLSGLYFGYELISIKSSFNYSFYLLNGSMWFMYSYFYGIYYYNYLVSQNLLTSMYWGEFYGGLGISYYILKLSNYTQIYSLGSLKIFLIVLIFWFIIFY
uniref:NADH-ubiquinone oxidoreductase chain 5 n=1 Tax=Yanocephalus yanonis TaxID=317752 RepID=A0A343KJ51_9HEMI|nr:NADH dehydrogenase subunit 5 [Yanocephalus yanonis]ATG83156.1 NADH dehydrogenase subunit 5 [Yanocephalus yanonis]